MAREDWSWTQVVTYVNASRDKERYIDVAGGGLFERCEGANWEISLSWYV